jgi:hypothetical protein
MRSTPSAQTTKRLAKLLEFSRLEARKPSRNEFAFTRLSLLAKSDLGFTFHKFATTSLPEAGRMACEWKEDASGIYSEFEVFVRPAENRQYHDNHDSGVSYDGL